MKFHRFLFEQYPSDPVFNDSSSCEVVKKKW